VPLLLLAANVIGYVPFVPVAGVPLNAPVAVLNVTPLGSAPVSLRVGAGKPVAVTVNVPAVPTENVVLAALVIWGAAGVAELKKTPLMTALGPPRTVTLIETCPAMAQTRYIPLAKLEMVCVLRTLLGLLASTIWTLSDLPA